MLESQACPHLWLGRIYGALITIPGSQLVIAWSEKLYAVRNNSTSTFRIFASQGLDYLSTEGFGGRMMRTIL